jgi:RNA polymerase sigma-70 factor (ECF subfamily)
MNELAALPARPFVTDAAEEREFERRLAEASTLAFRVAYGVLRSREDAEDVAQEAAVRAYRSFGSLRDRDSFRGWLARTAPAPGPGPRRSDRRRGRAGRPGSRMRGSPPSAEQVAAARQAEARMAGARPPPRSCGSSWCWARSGTQDT